MRALLLAFALSAAAVQAVPAGAQDAAVVPADRATALAERVLEPWISPSAQAQFAKAGFEAGLASDADAAAMLKEHPGLREDLLAAIEAEVRRAAPAQNAGFVKIVADIYRMRLTAAEIEALHSFYGTATGRKMMGAAMGAFDEKALVGEIVANQAVTLETMTKASDAAKQKAMGSIGLDDEAALTALGAAVAKDKMEAVSAEVAKVSVEWGNKPTPELDAAIGAAVQKVMARYGLSSEG